MLAAEEERRSQTHRKKMIPMLKADHARVGLSSAKFALGDTPMMVLARWSDDVSTSACGYLSRNGVGS